MEYEFLEGRPFWIVYSALYLIAFLRTQTIFWIGRGLGAGLHRSRYAARIGHRLRRAEELVNRYGPPVVTVSYLTVGVQSAIHLASGAGRMSYPRYLAAMLPGCAIWAAVYSLGGMAAIGAWLDLFVRAPVLAVALAVLVAAAVALLVLWRRRRRGAAPSDDDPSAAEPATSTPSH